MPSARSSQHRPNATPGSGNDRAAGTNTPTVDIPQRGYHRPAFRAAPIVPQPQHPEGLKEWQQLEKNHIAYGEYLELDTIGTSFIHGDERKHYQVELGIGTQGQTLLYRPDVIMHAGWDQTKWILVEDKWQRKGGSCEAKVFEVWWNLHQAITYDQRVVGAYLILDGPGWSEKNTERFKLMLSTMPSTVKVFFSDDDFIVHGIPEAWDDPAQATSKTPYAFGGPQQPQLRLA